MRIENEELVIPVFTARPSTLSVRLESEDVQVPLGPERMRASKIHRRIYDAAGHLVEHEVIAENRKRLLHGQAQKKRSCLSCGELACHARPSEAELKASRRLLETAGGGWCCQRLSLHGLTPYSRATPALGSAWPLQSCFGGPG
ncbi:MAG: hypothetical protein ACI9VR_004697 [Cognaticolwellia sp.]|jgi:hypothetical protein